MPKAFGHNRWLKLLGLGPLGKFRDLGDGPEPVSFHEKLRAHICLCHHLSSKRAPVVVAEVLKPPRRSSLCGLGSMQRFWKLT